MSGNDFDDVPQCFQIPATEKPGFFAVRSGTERLTYAGLDARTDALRERLTALGIEKGALVGILLDRSLSTITSLLAVLKAGGAFVPLDPSGPPQGILEIIQRHKLTCVVSNGATLRRFPQLAAAAPVIDVDAAPLAGPAGRRGEAAKISGSDPACVMFTSGSTGGPKGVVIPHRAIVRLVKKPSYMRFSDDQIFLQSSPLGFDASIFEIWGTLLNGAELVVPRAGLLSFGEIGAAMAIISLTPHETRCRVFIIETGGSSWTFSQPLISAMTKRPANSYKAFCGLMARYVHTVASLAMPMRLSAKAFIVAPKRNAATISP